MREAEHGVEGGSEWVSSSILLERENLPDQFVDLQNKQGLC